MIGFVNRACESKTNGALTNKSKDISQINQSKVYIILWNRKEIIYIKRKRRYILSIGIIDTNNEI